jgi:thiol-disulfide isomerase/thioredoxin
MKSILLALFLFSFSQLSAQKTISANDMIVKDSSGQVLSSDIWQALLMKGNYDLKPDGQNNNFLLVKLSDEQALKRMEKLAKPKPSTAFVDGKKTGLFKAKDLEGIKMNLDDSTGKIIVLNFWFINCGPCRKEIPDLNNLVDSFSKDKVEFVAVGLDSRDDIEKFIKSMPFKYRIVPDGRNIATNYGIRGYPTHAIIDQEGKIYFHTTGLAMNTIYWLKKSIKELIGKKDLANK